MKDNMPLVSIIITTHNRSKLLKRAIDSAINQTYNNIEIIIVDDASTDNTELVVQDFQKKNKNIFYIKNIKCLGANIGRNKGIKLANGKFIAGLDDDDEFLKNRIELLLEHYDKKYSLITSKNILYMENGKKKYLKGLEYINQEDILYSNHIGNQALIEKEKLIEVGLYDESLTASQDYDMWLRLIVKYGKAKSLNEYTQIIHSEHEFNRISKPSFRKFKGYFNFYKKHKHLMHSEHKKSQLLNIYISMNRPISLLTMKRLYSKRNKFTLLKYFIKIYFYNKSSRKKFEN